MTVWLVLVAGAFGLGLALHCMLCHVPIGTQMAKLFLVGGTGGVSLGAALLRAYGTSPELVSGLLVFGLAWSCYLFVYASAVNSVGVSVLMRLDRDEMTSADLRATYRADHMVGRRMDRLLRSSLVARTPRGYEVTPLGTRLLGLFLCIRRLFGHPPSDYFA